MRGIDVSNHNSTVDWAKVAKTGVTFAHAKATEGTTYFDPYFVANRNGAKAHGLHFGAYHFGRPERGAQAQAAYFCQKIGKPSPGDLRPVLDLEVGTGNLTVWAGQFLSEVEKQLGVRPILYSYSAFIQSHLNLKALAGYPLWVADYGPNDGQEHPARIQGVEHQFSSRGVISGVLGHVDLNSAPSLTPLLVPSPPIPKPPVSKAWPVPVPAWFWAWANWKQDGESYQRPWDAPRLIPPWAWVRLARL